MFIEIIEIILFWWFITNWNIYFTNFDDIINFVEVLPIFFNFHTNIYHFFFTSYKVADVNNSRYLSVIYVSDLYSWHTLAKDICKSSLVCKSESLYIYDAIPVYVENNFDCNVYVWSAPYLLVLIDLLKSIQ